MWSGFSNLTSHLEPWDEISVRTDHTRLFDMRLCPMFQCAKGKLCNELAEKSVMV